MLNELLVGGAVAASSGVVGFLIAKRITSSHFDLYLEQAKAKAKAIEAEAHLLLEKASLRANQLEKEAERHYNDISDKVKKDLADRINAVNKNESDFHIFRQQERDVLSKERNTLENDRKNLSREVKSFETIKKDYEQKFISIQAVIEKVANITEYEAKIMLFDEIKEKFRLEFASLTRALTEQTKEQMRKKANYILAQATTRFAGEYATEKLTSLIQIENDEVKGRIIGKEGRNIKTLEMVTGVDIIIDETPNTILVSSFNLYRRAIAVRTIELLIEDGRIQPARIEEIFQKVCDEFEEAVYRDGEEALFDLDIVGLDPEIVKLVGKLKYRASYGQNALAHTLEVAHLAGIIASEMGGDVKLAKRAGLLHDIGKALTQEAGGSHVELGASICKRYNEDPVVLNAIYAHHGYEEIQSIECAAVCAADTLSAARPGARREVLESFLRRVNDIEEIAASKRGVKQVYALNAGREVRVLVNADVVNDDETLLLSQEIAEEISQKVQFPGEIKVNVIRESRAINFAK